MTLILTVATQSKVLQASDRRLTNPDGSVFTDAANKAIMVFCHNAYFSISYTGLAYIGKTRTDCWLVDYLTDIQAGTQNFQFISNSLVRHLSRTFSGLNTQRQYMRLSLVLSGYVSQGPFMQLISNFERWRPRSVEQLPDKDFHVEGVMRKEIANPKKVLALVISGAEAAVTQAIHFKLARLRKKRFFQNNDRATIAKKLVSLIREASCSPSHGHLIGRDCMTIALSQNAVENVEAEYHPEGQPLLRYAPHIIHPAGSMKDIWIKSGDECGTHFFPRE